VKYSEKLRECRLWNTGLNTIKRRLS